MRYYPVLLDLADRPCVVVGGGAVAESKVAALVAAAARVTVIAPALGPGLAAQLRAGRFIHVPRAYRSGDLAGAFLVIGATDDTEVNHAVHAEAISIGALINVVDDVPYCQFILPSILRRGDLTVAVSSAGHAPALAVRLRERLEREIGDEYGRFLELAAEIRARLATAVPDFEQRKAIWYRLVDSDVLALLRAGNEQQAWERIASITGLSTAPSPLRETQLAAVTAFSSATGVGTVYLVGAGPGDPRLITVRGLEALRRADVVVYDRLMSPALLDEAPAAAERVYAGKAPHGRCVSQEGINALLIAEARLGKTVVRLKGGDPFVFGRGAEEALACVEAGVPVEFVPGVSSVLGATASAGIPVTARGYAGGFAVITAHRAGSAEEGDAHDWAALARMDTLVVLMGVERLPYVVARLLEHGKAADTPVAIIENGTLATERVIGATLADVVERARAAGVHPPAVVIVGDVVRLREALGAQSDAGRPATGARHVA
ncbi:MAG TPA: siroheme synthase CysG [Gemmatimonadales bacterium]|nr:siroheme synthase CysG [Gemmatimonadales bacterium]